MGAELDFLNFIQDNLTSPVMDAAMMSVSYSMTFDALWGIIAVMFLFSKRFRLIGVALLLALIFTEVVGNGILKPIIDRPRPFDVNPIDLLIPAPMTSSFPSIHTASSVAAATVIFMYARKYTAYCTIFAASVAFSRMYLYVHYPTDILGGIVLGIVCGYAAYRLSEYLVDKTSLGEYVERIRC